MLKVISLGIKSNMNVHSVEIMEGNICIGTQFWRISFFRLHLEYPELWGWMFK